MYTTRAKINKTVGHNVSRMSLNQYSFVVLELLYKTNIVHKFVLLY